MCVSSSSGTVLMTLSAIAGPVPMGPGGACLNLDAADLSRVVGGVGFPVLPKYCPNTICFLPPELISSSMAAFPSAVRRAISSAAGVDLRRPVLVGLIMAAMAAGARGACCCVKDPFTWTGGKADLLPEEPSTCSEAELPARFLRLKLLFASVSMSATAELLEKDLRENGDLDTLDGRS